MDKIVECVPNFSEGCKQSTIDAIAKAIRETPGCTLLDVDPGKSTNRTVYTFVGSPAAAVNGAINAARVARPLIDMRTQKGEHPRNGAMDVCPFVPVANMTMEECVACANEFGRRMAAELSLPCYLYGAAAKIVERANLSQLRVGEYEALAKKLGDSTGKHLPDYGPREFVPEWGVTATGARPFLIAYNINILGTKEQAHRIALRIREQGSSKKPGRFRKLKAIGWWVDDYEIAQISCNFDDFTVTAPHTVYESVKSEDAAELKVGVMGSEIVGLVPKQALLDAAKYYCQRDGLMILEEKQRIAMAVDRLGLSAVKHFDPKTRIIEYMLPQASNKALVSLSVNDFVLSVAARTAAPGGGSISALATACGLALGQMMAFMSYGNVQWQHVDAKMRDVLPTLHERTRAAVPLVDEDAQAFDSFMKAMQLPKATDAEQKARTTAMQDALKDAVEVPLKTMRAGSDPECWSRLLTLAQLGNMKSRSDLEVGAKMLETGVWGASRNVVINLGSITDKEYVTRTQLKVNEMLAFTRKQFDAVCEALDARTRDAQDKKSKE